VTIRVVCPNRKCRRVLRMSAEWVQRIRVRCVNCGETFTVYAKDGYLVQRAVKADNPKVLVTPE